MVAFTSAGGRTTQHRDRASTPCAAPGKLSRAHYVPGDDCSPSSRRRRYCPSSAVTKPRVRSVCSYCRHSAPSRRCVQQPRVRRRRAARPRNLKEVLHIRPLLSINSQSNGDITIVNRCSLRFLQFIHLQRSIWLLSMCFNSR